MTEFDQKKFNVHVVKVIQHIVDITPHENHDKQFYDDFGVLCELLWTYDPDYNGSEQTVIQEET